jgi:hypothetical protein
MAKAYQVCKLCKSRKFLNYAGLCKKCNRDKAGIRIKEEVLLKKNVLAKAAEETAVKEAEQQKEADAVEAKAETTEEASSSETKVTKEPSTNPKETKEEEKKE